jgi:hypothetical protein
MAFSPNKPERPQDLVCVCDPDINQAITIFYDSGEGLFYRDKGQWKEILEEDDWEFDLDGTVSFYVDPIFIAVYDSADMEDYAVPIDLVAEYQSAPNEWV